MKNSPSSRGSLRTRMLVGVLVLAVAGGGAYAVVSGAGADLVDTSEKPPAATGSNLVEEAPPGTRPVTLLVDGWSKRILDDTKTFYTASTSETRAAEEEPVREELHFAPVTDADLGAITETAPEFLENTAARMVTLDPSLSCDTEGCRTGTAELSYELFKDPSTIPGYGESYAAYGINSALYKAELYLPEDVENVTIDAVGYASILDLDFTEPTHAGESIDLRPDGRDWYFFGAAFGRFFTPESGWKGQDLKVDRSKVFTNAEPSMLPVAPENLEEPLEEPLLAGGLANPVPQVAGFTDAQMTYYSSPTTGCGPATVCIPGKVDVTYSEESVRESIQACFKESGNPLTLVFHTRRWNVTYPAPTHQFGVWNGLTREQFTGYDPDSKALVSGQPPLVEGTQTLYVSEVEMLSGVEGLLWNVAGWIAQEGADPEDAFEFTYTPDMVDEIYGGRLESC